MDVHLTFIIIVLFSSYILVQSQKNVNQEKVKADKAEKRRIHTNKRHLKKHLKEIGFRDDKTIDAFMDDFPGVTHFFMMHDFDGNSKLDGLEILKGLWHDSEHEHEDDEDNDDQHKNEEKGKKHGKPQNKPNSLNEEEDEAIQETDRILEIADVDKDGYIAYLEFITHLSNDEIINKQKN